MTESFFVATREIRRRLKAYRLGNVANQHVRILEQCEGVIESDIKVVLAR